MIEIVKLELIQKGPLIAKFSIKLHKWGGVVIRECTFFDSKGNQWVNFPSKEYESEGKKKYYSYIAYENQDLDKKFKESILKAVLEYLDKMKVIASKYEERFECNEEIPF